jgi:hypothetical protein
MSSGHQGEGRLDGVSTGWSQVHRTVLTEDEQPVLEAYRL